MSESGEVLVHVEDRVGGDIELLVMRAHDRRGVSGVGIDPEEVDAIDFIGSLQPLDFGDIAIGDGAVRSGERRGPQLWRRVLRDDRQACR